MATAKTTKTTVKPTVSKTPVKPVASKTAKVAPKATCGTSACACSARASAMPVATKKAVPAAAPAKSAPVTTKKAAVAPPAPAKSAPATKRVSFTVRADPGSLVTIAGSFNNWDPLSHPLLDAEEVGTYTTTLALQPGTYEYKLVINGTWCVDPNCPEWTQNEFGTLNSVCKVA
jgi:hypothetical protein